MSTIKEISYEQLMQLISEGAELVDVREEEEYSDGKLRGSKDWPLSSFGLRQGDISRTRPTIFYCRSGLRSLKAAEIAASWTDQQLFSLQGGFLGLTQQDGAAKAKN